MVETQSTHRLGDQDTLAGWGVSPALALGADPMTAQMFKELMSPTGSGDTDEDDDKA